MADLGHFDATAIDPTPSRDALPAGEYKMVCIESDYKPTKAGNGRFLQMVFEVVEGPHKGRRVWERLNLDNPNQTAVEIAKQTLSAICRAVNVMQPKDSSQLHNIPLVVKVKCREYNGNVSNEVSGYKKLGAATAPVNRPSATEPVASSGSAPAQDSLDTPPW
jgi:hypothetical protein